MSSEYLIKISSTGLATPYVCARQQCERHLSWLLMLNDLRWEEFVRFVGIVDHFVSAEKIINDGFSYSENV